MAPLPILGESNHRAQNAWQCLVESVPVDAEQERYRPTTSELPPATRANIRTGELFFSQEGITIHGLARRTDKIFDLVKLFCVSVILGSIVGLLFSVRLSGGWKVVFAITPVLIAILLFIYSSHGEQRRQAVAETILWKDIIGAQTDNKIRSISLLYSAPSERTGRVLPHFFTLNGLPPATVLNIADTVAHYAPHAKCIRVPKWEWTPQRKIIYGCFAALALLMIGAAILRLLDPAQP